jgi:hypothetical protein
MGGGPTCTGGQILSCSGGMQTVEEDCGEGYGCTDDMPPYCNECPPGQPYCAPSGDLVQCGLDGLPGLFLQDCPTTCSAGPPPSCD